MGAGITDADFPLRPSYWFIIQHSLCSVNSGVFFSWAAIGFNREYTQKAPGTYVPGELNYDSEYLEASRIILQDFWQKDCQTMFEAKDLFLKKYSASLWDLEEAVRKPTKISQMKLAEMMHLGIKQLTGHLKNPQGHVCVDFMVALCLNLRRRASDRVLRSCIRCRCRVPRNSWPFRCPRSPRWSDPRARR